MAWSKYVPSGWSYHGVRISGLSKGSDGGSPNVSAASSPIQDEASAEENEVTTIFAYPSQVTGASERLVGSCYLAAGTYNVRTYAGSLGTLPSSGSVKIKRLAVPNTTLLTVTVSGSKSLLGPSTLIISTADVYEVYVSGANYQSAIDIEWLHFKVA